ncbi:hypothetical protein [Aquimarina sp. AU58]|uniref:hypothetical protein n=1 Tax=Aquimarina sp. AU58 TaxID=1874112 RepID=UPI000D65DD0E|nr:hypothetical protein [Aquimarina sp. AU58]
MKKTIFLALFSITLLSCSDDENANPTSFEILEFYYSRGCGDDRMDQREFINFSFNLPTDSDGDKISYEMNFGGLIWDLPSDGINTIYGFSGFKDGVGNFIRITEVNLPADFPDFSGFEEVEFKITARDGKGGESVVSKVFNVTATDVDLGTLSLPYTNVVSYDKKNEVIDEKIEYTFTVENEVNYNITFELTDDGSSSDRYPLISIYNKTNGEVVQNNNSENPLLLNGTLSPGVYILSAKSHIFPIFSGGCIPLNDLRAGNVTITME